VAFVAPTAEVAGSLALPLVETGHAHSLIAMNNLDMGRKGEDARSASVPASARDRPEPFTGFPVGVPGPTGNEHRSSSTVMRQSMENPTEATHDRPLTIEN
jgi:hypothetical protein